MPKTIKLADAEGGTLVLHEGEPKVVIKRSRANAAPGYMRRLCSLATGSLCLLPSKLELEVLPAYKLPPR